MIRAIVTFGGAGLLRPAPGTWGSLAALPAAWVILTLGGPWALVSLTVAVTALGLWATGQEIAATGDHDPAHVVIDEVAGQWIALLPVGFGAAMTGALPLDLWPGWVAAFLLFRLFDIWKPGPIGWADRRGDALGVMLDDLIAGVFAAMGLLALAAVAHGVLRAAGG
jgi:phosphatidylglycerophosphatase A